jgi:hypothetical protein
MTSLSRFLWVDSVRLVGSVLAGLSLVGVLGSCCVSVCLVLLCGLSLAEIGWGLLVYFIFVQ